MDRYGTTSLLFGLSLCVCVGQLLFTIGVIENWVGMMMFGRLVFGIGGESIGVAQTRITTEWFRGRQLAFALGMNIAVGRVGSVFNG
jgi:MFS family permease